MYENVMVGLQHSLIVLTVVGWNPLLLLENHVSSKLYIYSTILYVRDNLWMDPIEGSRASGAKGESFGEALSDNILDTSKPATPPSPLTTNHTALTMAVTVRTAPSDILVLENAQHAIPLARDTTHPTSILLFPRN
jgi:hypothetical protein